MPEQFRIYNTMSRSVETFKARRDKKVGIFTCGPSTYRRPHIGNYRTFLYEDIVVRYLEYLGYEVHRVINFTDVEDKTIVEAEHKGKNIEEVTNEVHDHFFRETEMLGIQLPDEIPRSSTSVDQAVTIIKKLIKTGYAYWHEGDVFFDPLKFDGFGKLFRLDMSKWPKKKVRFKRDTYNGNRWNRGDFVLWHGHENEKTDSAYWDTDIGKGRPAWNIQDPAMILQQIGTQVDINCGGIDNIYRHHDYNIAVMEAYSGKSYANYYMHGAHLIVDGKPMSKSRGNILYPEDLVKRGFEHKHLRFFLIYRHYRKKSNFTTDNFERVSAKLDAFRGLYRELATTQAAGERSESVTKLVESIETVFREAMNDDMFVGKAFDNVFEVLKRLREATKDQGLHPEQKARLADHIRSIDRVFGVIIPQ